MDATLKEGHSICLGFQGDMIEFRQLDHGKPTDVV